MAQSSKVIFNTAAVAAHLTAVKAAVYAAAPDGHEDEIAWWKSPKQVIIFDWQSPRKGNNGTQWVTINYNDEHGVTGSLVLRFNGEKHTGQIMPLSDSGLAELTANKKSASSVTFEKRTKGVCMAVQKWNVQVKTSPDGLTILNDEEGNPILPDDKYLSAYFIVASLVNEAFNYEAKLLLEDGSKFVAKISELKRADRALTAQSTLDKFTSSHGARKNGSMILTTEGVSTLRKLFTNQKDVDILTKGSIISTSGKVVNLIQTNIGEQAKANVGALMPNPMTRVSLSFDPITYAAQMLFYDKSAPILDEGKKKYEAGAVNGEPVNGENIHKFLLSRSLVDGILRMDSVCFSNMGISIPSKADVVVVLQPPVSARSLDDVYEDDCAVVSVVATAFASAVVSTVASGVTVPDDNYDDILNDLGK